MSVPVVVWPGFFFFFLFVGENCFREFAFYAGFCVPSEFYYITLHAVGLKQALITHASSVTVQLKPVGDTISLKNHNLNCNLLLGMSLSLCW